MSISRKLDKLPRLASDALRDWRCGLLFRLFPVVYAHPSHMVSLHDPDLDLERYKHMTTTSAAITGRSAVEDLTREVTSRAGRADCAHDREVPEVDLFTPITIRGVTFRNRIVMSPMCMYSADDG